MIHYTLRELLDTQVILDEEYDSQPSPLDTLRDASAHYHILKEKAHADF